MGRRNEIIDEDGNFIGYYRPDPDGNILERWVSLMVEKILRAKQNQKELNQQYQNWKDDCIAKNRSDPPVVDLRGKRVPEDSSTDTTWFGYSPAEIKYNSPETTVPAANNTGRKIFLALTTIVFAGAFVINYVSNPIRSDNLVSSQPGQKVTFSAEELQDMGIDPVGVVQAYDNGMIRIFDPKTGHHAAPPYCDNGRIFDRIEYQNGTLVTIHNCSHPPAAESALERLAKQTETP